MLNLVIKMDKGTVYEIVWDNGCFTCKDDKCEKDLISKSVDDDNNILKYENCFENCEKDNTDENLEPKFYITWFGSDKNKRQLKTAGLAMTKFKPYISESFRTSIRDLL